MNYQPPESYRKAYVESLRRQYKLVMRLVKLRQQALSPREAVAEAIDLSKEFAP